MQDLTVICGQCGAEVAVTESLAAPLLEASKKEFDRRLAEKNQEIRDQLTEMEKRRENLATAEAALDETIAKRVKDAAAKLAAEAEKKAKAAVQEEMSSQNAALREAESLLKSRTDALKEAKDAAVALRKDKIALEEQQIALAATVQDKVEEELNKTKDRLAAEFSVELAKKLADKDKQIEKARHDSKATVQEEANKNKIELEKQLAKQKKELDAAKQDLSSRTDELETAKKAEAEFMKAKRHLEDEKRKMAVTIQEKIDEELETSRTTLRTEMERELKLKVREKDVVLESMKAEIANLKRKSEQGSQQVQGEVWERELFDVLSAKFPHDTIRRVTKGEYGGDCLQEVRSVQGKLCGLILWESKRTKNWDDKWLSKLKSDQRTAKADTAIIVSHVLPKDLSNFEQRDEVWITGPDCLIPVAGALRHLLIEVFTTKRANAGHQDKAALVYQYVTSLTFKQRVTALAEAYSSMQDDLKSEQKAIKKQWAKREAQLERMIDATAGMFGDLQGIAGKSVLEIDALSFAKLGAGS